MSTRSAFNRYLGGLACTFAGAWAAGETGSMLPLALGAAVTVMTTLPLVGAVWRRRRR